MTRPFAFFRVHVAMRKHLPFVVILVLYAVTAGIFAVQLPPWQAPDEPAHYNVVRQIATNGCCPLIEMGDWDSPLLDMMKANQFVAAVYDGYVMESALPTIQYEDHQPPLYYMLLAPVYSLTGGSLIALRLASVVIGAGVVIAAYAVALRAFPGRFSIAWTAAAFVAFLPQHVHILASVNNDALALALCGAILWACIDYADGGRTPAWALGLLVGAAFLTKTTAYMMAGVALLALWIRMRAAARDTASGARPVAVTLQPFIVFLIPAAVLGALWWLRNIGVYGFPDFLGLRAHDEVVVGQLRTADHIAAIGAGQYASDALTTIVTSFYGQFGWMAVPLHSFALGMVVLFALIVATVGGVALAFVSPVRRLAARGTWRIFGATVLLAMAMLAYYNTSFVQFQGRYMYPLLIPLAVTVAVGLDLLREKLPAGGRFPWLIAALFGLVAVADVYIIMRVVAPYLTP